jgi:hypothetical protein
VREVPLGAISPDQLNFEALGKFDERYEDVVRRDRCGNSRRLQVAAAKRPSIYVEHILPRKVAPDRQRMAGGAEKGLFLKEVSDE